MGNRGLTWCLWLLVSPALKCVALRVPQLPLSSLHWETRVLLWKVSLKMPAVFSRLNTISFGRILKAVTVVIAASAVLVETYCFFFSSQL